MSEQSSDAPSGGNVPPHVHSNFAAARAELLDGVAGAAAGTATSTAEIPAALTALTDAWLREVFSYETPPNISGAALVAVGGYGRSELCPRSDIDLLLLHSPDTNTGDLADRIWYPVWDQRLKLGHAVRTVDDSIQLGTEDIDTATALLDARHIAGDAELTAELAQRINQHWQDNSAQCLRELAQYAKRRQRLNGEVAFLLEPNLKLGRGGLRDVQTVHWAQRAGVAPAADDLDRLEQAYRTLLRARVALHILTGRSSDVLLADEQPPVAEMLELASSDALMYDIAVAARDVAFISDHAWRTVPNGGVPPADLDRPDAASNTAAAEQQLASAEQLAAAGLELVNNELVIRADPADDELLVLRAAEQAARRQVRISRESLDLLGDRQQTLSDPWPSGARELFVGLLQSGEAAIDVIESLDFVGVWTRVLPEWAPNRSRPQRSRYHRFTVDRHLLEAVSLAAELTDKVERSDLLLVGALLHDLGKGYPGDHTQVGMGLAATIGKRCGWNEADTKTLVRLVQHHLLLTDTATRRDLDDPRTIEHVAQATETAEFLKLLATLTEADCRATGPTAWTEWIADLTGTLVDLVGEFFAGSGDLLSQRRELRDEALNKMLEQRTTQVVGSDDTVTVVAPDQRGTFSKVAGALALRGLDVLQAEAFSRAGSAQSDPAQADQARPMAVSVFKIAPPDTPVDWDRVAADVKRALNGALALDARIAERARLYARRTTLAASTPQTAVTFNTVAATDATIIQVRTEDRIGVLYRLTEILSSMGLDIVSAKIQTIANEVVDTFYVTGATGPVLSEEHQREIELALQHGLKPAD